MATQVELGVPRKPEVKADVPQEPFNVKEFLSEVKIEFSKVSWPSRDQVTQEFFAVLILVFVISGIIFVLDIVFGKVSDFFMGKI